MAVTVGETGTSGGRLGAAVGQCFGDHEVPWREGALMVSKARLKEGRRQRGAGMRALLPGGGGGAGQDLPCGLPPSASEQRMEAGRGLWVLLRTPVAWEILPEWGHHHGPPRQRLCGPWVGEVASGLIL